MRDGESGVGVAVGKGGVNVGKTEVGVNASFAVPACVAGVGINRT
jgi:hypothetical protein